MTIHPFGLTLRRIAAFALVAIAVAGCAAPGTPVPQAEPDKLVADARTTLNNFLRDPDQTWIQENLGRAKAVLIVPQLVKAGFIFGGSGGRARARGEGRTLLGWPGVLQPRNGQRGLPGRRRSLRGHHRGDDGQGTQLAAVDLVQGRRRREHRRGSGGRGRQVRPSRPTSSRSRARRVSTAASTSTAPW